MAATPSMEEYRARIQAREKHIHESWIKAMEARIVRDELTKCYRGEGVNSLQNCKHLAEMYVGMVRDNKVGPIFVDG
ncbi:uncharacterized protein L203_102154 [Cryptococcus depauperatus CBS 7841]|uniref:Uncharacterized protein n=1 Tax=Cryptococcus depauperatus CBS 7841 TaxID=1295531 RepID=A0A1E3IRH2_9TREE|nr:NADH dehydrogenase [Cryptococcus depauperatus CBS 7841]ODN95488.1 NADH dehydrogenase [Cryptococcus depauperatus CBS 7855]